MLHRISASIAAALCLLAASPTPAPTSTPLPAPARTLSPQQQLAQDEQTIFVLGNTAAQVDGICERAHKGHGLNAFRDPAFPYSVVVVRIQCEGGQLEQRWVPIRSFPTPRPTPRIH